MKKVAVNTVRKPVGQILIDEGVLAEQQLQEGLRAQAESGGALGDMLIELGFIGRDELIKALATQYGLKFVNISDVDFPPELIAQISPSIACVYRVVPASMENGVLTVAMADPLNIRVLDDLRFMLNMRVEGAVADPAVVNRIIEEHYASKTESLQELIDSISQDIPVAGIPDLTDQTAIDIGTLKQVANLPPIMKLVNLVLLQAIRDQSSDVHFEPFEDQYRIRYRIDGVLYEMPPPPRHLGAAISSRAKVMAEMQIEERRLPQDGRIALNVAGNPIDVRVSTLPTMFGESVVMRILDRSVVELNVENLGLRQEDLEDSYRLLRKPNGIVLVTGPTGCGKTTTLYAFLNYLNTVGVKIVTTEDPVEYDLAGVTQVQINERIGLTFSRCLRSILRQDPDKILVGEVRDLATAQMAIQASLTGHLVLTTLHTNDAPTAVTRLVDLGVEPYLLTATIEGIMAQRLVRKVCSRCKRPYTPSPEELMELGLRGEDVEGKQFFKGMGCPICKNTGYRGRTAIFEILVLNDEIKRLVLSNASTSELREAAIRNGMRTLRDSGLLAVFDGTTTVEEVAKETVFVQIG